MGNDAPEVLADQIGMVAQCLRDRAEDDALLGQRLAESGLHRDGVHHGIDCNACQCHLLLERNAQFVERALELGIDLVHRAEGFLRLGRRIIDDVLKIDFGDVQVGPRGRLERQPMAVGRHAPLGHPLRLALPGRNLAHDLLREPLAEQFGFDVGRKAVFVFLIPDVLQDIAFVFCHSKPNIVQRYKISEQNRNPGLQI